MEIDFYRVVARGTLVTFSNEDEAVAFYNELAGATGDYVRLDARDSDGWNPMFIREAVQ